MSKKFEIPNNKNSFEPNVCIIDKLYFILFRDLLYIDENILKYLDKPVYSLSDVKELEIKKLNDEKSKNNLIHQFDLKIRNEISNIYKNNKSILYFKNSK